VMSENPPQERKAEARSFSPPRWQVAQTEP
jgi:hypothetical protein